ncbi:MAG: DUF2520 domain-containing protein [Bacteroidota bacterium]
MSVFIIGSGNIAYHLTLALNRKRIEIKGLFSRNEKEGNAIAKKAKIPFYNSYTSIPHSADIYLICVSDDAIQIVADQLPSALKESKIIAHTSGSKSIEETLVECKNGGVFYPLQTFTKGKRMSYHSIPFCINGNNKKTEKTLFALGETISNSVHFIDDKQRKSIHLSAVIINNFVNHLIMISEDLLHEKDIDPNILQPLLDETIKKQKKLGAVAAQTGPARRQDSKTITVHLELLTAYKEYTSIYKAISKSIGKSYKSEK